MMKLQVSIPEKAALFQRSDMVSISAPLLQPGWCGFVCTRVLPLIPICMMRGGVVLPFSVLPPGAMHEAAALAPCFFLPALNGPAHAS
jgi:hypothetical protein